jgi:hypothetical protein
MAAYFKIADLMGNLSTNGHAVNLATDSPQFISQKINAILKSYT